jgi:polysaccharide deacetylase family protein (PEP-CTERM system associated)
LKNKNIFLFSVDLEDVRDGVAGGDRYKDRVVANTLKYLDWLKKNNAACTFFVVGRIAEKYPDLVKEIILAGHELACHSYAHIPVVLQTPDTFRKDLDMNINALLKCGSPEIRGFRAPVYSLTQKSQWAYEILAESGITYSSSVLPAKSPLYGWKEFGQAPKKVGGKILEVPLSLARFGHLNIPFGGGVYFRSLPFGFIRSAFKKSFEGNKPVLGYFHPYDLDTEQEKFMHGGINNNSFFNFLMYYNRKNLLNRLNRLADYDITIMTYQNYVNTLLSE